VSDIKKGKMAVFFSTVMNNDFVAPREMFF